MQMSPHSPRQVQHEARRQVRPRSVRCFGAVRDSQFRRAGGDSMTGHNRIPTKRLISDELFRDLVVGAAVGVIVAFIIILAVIA